MKSSLLFALLLPVSCIAADFTPSELLTDLKVISQNEDNITEDLAMWMTVYDRSDSKPDAKALARKYIQEDIKQLTEVYADLKAVKVVPETKSTKVLSYAK